MAIKADHKIDYQPDPRVEEIDRELRVHGHRFTPRRLMVVEVLSRHEGHLTGEEILDRVRKRHPSTDKTTVYRTLELLSSLGMVVVTDMGSGRMEYELTSNPHHHLICERCNTRIEVEDSFFEPLRDRLLSKYGFSTNLAHFALFGVCPACKAKEES
jgi:Fur family ferric uptake transcriptional regulator